MKKFELEILNEGDLSSFLGGIDRGTTISGGTMHISTKGKDDTFHDTNHNNKMDSGECVTFHAEE